MANRDIIVVGASAGGPETLTELVAALPADLPASVFVVQHTAPYPPSALAEVLDRHSTLPIQTAMDRQPIQRGHIYVAPSDYHLLVDRSYTFITRGPRENRTRPAIDPLFRSAAVVHGPHVVGVILSGTLDDGTSGLAAVKRCGGVAVVQDPADAAYPDMPQNALDAVQVDYCVALSEMGDLLAELTAEEPGAPSPPPIDLLGEVEIARSAAGGTDRLNELGDLAPYTCAECGGPLWKMRDADVTRFRCREGHAYTARTLAAEQSAAAERSLWVAVQTLDERTRMLERLAREDTTKGRQNSANSFLARAAESKEHADRLRNLLLTVNTMPRLSPS